MKKIWLIIISIIVLLGFLYIYTILHAKDEFITEDVYETIKKRGVIKVGINSNAKPYGFYDNKGKFVGFDVDLARYIARYIVKNPDKIEIIPLTTSTRLIKASTGEVDIVISTLTITPQREEVVSFSIPYDVAGQAILVNANSHIKSLSDLSGENVGIIFGTTAEKNIKNLVPTANLLGFRSYSDAYVALKNGKINAITSDDTILNRFVIDDKSVKLLPKRYSKEPYGIAFQKGETTIKLKENLDIAIRDLKQKNVIKRLRKKWKLQ